MCVRLEFASGLGYWCIAEHIFEHFVWQQRFRSAGVNLHIDVKSIYFYAFPPVVFACVSDGIDQMCAAVII